MRMIHRPLHPPGRDGAAARQSAILPDATFDVLIAGRIERGMNRSDPATRRWGFAAPTHPPVVHFDDDRAPVTGAGMCCSNHREAMPVISSSVPGSENRCVALGTSTRSLVRVAVSCVSAA